MTKRKLCVYCTSAKPRQIGPLGNGNFLRNTLSAQLCLQMIACVLTFPNYTIFFIFSFLSDTAGLFCLGIWGNCLVFDRTHFSAIIWNICLIYKHSQSEKGLQVLKYLGIMSSLFASANCPPWNSLTLFEFYFPIIYLASHGKEILYLRHFSLSKMKVCQTLQAFTKNRVAYYEINFFHKCSDNDNEFVNLYPTDAKKPFLRKNVLKSPADTVAKRINPNGGCYYQNYWVFHKSFV